MAIKNRAFIITNISKSFETRTKVRAPHLHGPSFRQTRWHNIPPRSLSFASGPITTATSLIRRLKPATRRSPPAAAADKQRAQVWGARRVQTAPNEGHGRCGARRPQRAFPAYY
ncbi:hypothetical protein EVAR_29902_1 [Eumeta japonica]|uniref:Uncharacterized protein n=1 Tax=Eumeta variegata TaxID=151549 RepID=A0A4C1V864_EUMVA|nr:hypothetical protein EVAR_29902_1 [Eumeta japonica]